MKQKMISDVMRHLRSIPSEERSEASRTNGRKGGRPRSNFDTRFHRDGSITYWSVYEQVWRRASSLEDEDLAALSSEERARVERHFARHR